MPPRGAIEQLPETVKANLDKRLIGGGFANYQVLAQWLAEQGYAISKSALHRYGQRFEDRVAALKTATEQARAITEAAPDEAGVMGDALTRMTQERLFGLLMELQDEDAVSVLPKVGRVVADLARASVSQKKWLAEARAKAELAASKVEEQIKKEAPGLSPNTIDTIRRQILGIAA